MATQEAICLSACYGLPLVLTCYASLSSHKVATIQYTASGWVFVLALGRYWGSLSKAPRAIRRPSPAGCHLAVLCAFENYLSALGGVVSITAHPLFLQCPVQGLSYTVSTHVNGKS